MVPQGAVLVERREGGGKAASSRVGSELSSDKEDFVILCNSVVTEKILTIGISSHASRGLVQLLVQQHAEPCRLSRVVDDVLMVEGPQAWTGVKSKQILDAIDQVVVVGDGVEGDGSRGPHRESLDRLSGSALLQQGRGVDLESAHYAFERLACLQEVILKGGNP